ncbi:hypothetical protein HBB16_05720 [Pseudonocardia sp. MCCB 268]|nr:hypothetical protein [Pseudonocardia cytotoxica]
MLIRQIAAQLGELQGQAWSRTGGVVHPAVPGTCGPSRSTRTRWAGCPTPGALGWDGS